MKKQIAAVALACVFAGCSEGQAPSQTPVETPLERSINAPAFIDANCSSNVLKTGQTLEVLGIDPHARAIAVSCTNLAGKWFAFADLYDEGAAQDYVDRHPDVARRIGTVVGVGDTGSDAFAAIYAAESARG